MYPDWCWKKLEGESHSKKDELKEGRERGSVLSVQMGRKRLREVGRMNVYIVIYNMMCEKGMGG